MCMCAVWAVSVVCGWEQVFGIEAWYEMKCLALVSGMCNVNTSLSLISNYVFQYYYGYGSVVCSRQISLSIYVCVF